MMHEKIRLYGKRKADAIQKATNQRTTLVKWRGENFETAEYLEMVINGKHYRMTPTVH